MGLFKNIHILRYHQQCSRYAILQAGHFLDGHVAAIATAKDTENASPSTAKSIKLYRTPIRHSPYQSLCISVLNNLDIRHQSFANTIQIIIFHLPL